MDVCRGDDDVASSWDVVGDAGDGDGVRWMDAACASGDESANRTGDVGLDV